jgi:hypothetical protein
MFVAMNSLKAVLFSAHFPLYRTRLLPTHEKFFGVNSHHSAWIPKHPAF